MTNNCTAYSTLEAISNMTSVYDHKPISMVSLPIYVDSILWYLVSSLVLFPSPDAFLSMAYQARSCLGGDQDHGVS
jgi:hypothetical protein